MVWTQGLFGYLQCLCSDNRSLFEIALLAEFNNPLIELLQLGVSRLRRADQCQDKYGSRGPKSQKPKNAGDFLHLLAPALQILTTSCSRSEGCLYCM